jgi:hypothetical protein
MREFAKPGRSVARRPYGPRGGQGEASQQNSQHECRRRKPHSLSHCEA